MRPQTTGAGRRALSYTGALALLLTLSTGLAAEREGKSQAWQGEMHDAWLDGKIETSLTLNRYLNPFAIDTDVQDGVVTLSGIVESEVDKELAGEIALGVDGVKKVENKLEVRTGAAEAGESTATAGAAPDQQGRDFAARFDDATTTARVKYALLTHDGTDALDIDVDTVNGVVFLTGRVKSGEERDLAGELAANTEGVGNVENKLEVTGRE
ncbi:BON domain-containing protein [Thioalkalivibrio sp. XN8]|uniref:BON domain-containing protein n=1 Tax=Thioalkalivibrio sp. XN8 TaxID=2712863 RepID=UPI0013EDF259|nr:BON domain-containing protein [Thioalkalivibrio sp. XN8]NGP54508.1 BON domain-containing protein [Thioalkalivibrio sp. XN8]